MLAVGVDVAEERKGLDLVAIDSDRHVVASRGRMTVDTVAALIVDELRPDVVCIDSPTGWSLSGKSRQAERELAKRRISSFATGADPGDHSFFRWMRVGFRVFEAIRDDYPLYRSGSPAGRAAEVFPNASAVLLAGRERDPSESKLQFRRAIVASQGVDVDRVPGIDRIDAALAALTGLLALEGQFSCVGNPDEGVILLPVTPTVGIPAVASVSRKAPPSRFRSLDGDCMCGCGAPVRRRFLPGHDAKLRSRLLAEWRGGDACAEARLHELGWLSEHA